MALVLQFLKTKTSYNNGQKCRHSRLNHRPTDCTQGVADSFIRVFKSASVDPVADVGGKVNAQSNGHLGRYYDLLKRLGRNKFSYQNVDHSGRVQIRAPEGKIPGHPNVHRDE